MAGRSVDGSAVCDDGRDPFLVRKFADYPRLNILSHREEYRSSRAKSGARPESIGIMVLEGSIAWIIKTHNG
ncbi:hypothetical protein KSZ_52450 [Dictyobacter formicarum]|uniref:Uncharacterized protein n=1 Tax=Dictyobacter formicarum TaxID=2778368 RepID=A0ABQ3VM10_9CHLR|nr:hypothetical protein KSZ_52450 [Dictyobacter formicarum]